MIFPAHQNFLQFIVKRKDVSSGDLLIIWNSVNLLNPHITKWEELTIVLKSRRRIEKYPDKLEKYSRKKYSGIEKEHVQGCVLRQIEDDKGWSKYQF